MVRMWNPSIPLTARWNRKREHSFRPTPCQVKNGSAAALTEPRADRNMPAWRFCLRHSEDGRLIRVLHVIATLDPAGAEQQLVHLCRRLDRGGFSPAVCCLTRGGPLEEDLRKSNIPLHILHKRGRWDLRVIARAARVMQAFRPQIVHTWLPTANTLGRIAALVARTPALIASERAADAWKGPPRRCVDRLLGRRTARILTNSEAVRRFLAERIGLPAQKIIVIRNGLDVTEFDAAASQGPTLPLRKTPGRSVIGTVGRLAAQKGITYLIDAFSRLPRDLGALELWVVGGGDQEPHLRAQVAATGLSDRVRFLGIRPDVPAVLGNFDLFVLPSLWEGLPNAVLEAMAARRAVVATAVDGTPEAVEDGKTGLLVPAADPAALAQAMERLLRDANLRASFGEAGRHRVEAEFGMQRMVAETQDAYRSALKEEALRPHGH